MINPIALSEYAKKFHSNLVIEPWLKLQKIEFKILA